jgi:putative photosynthetic complex assembly protein
MTTAAAQVSSSELLSDPTSLRMPLFAAGALVVLSIAAVAAVRVSGMPISTPDAPVVVARVLQFTDRKDGGIDVTDLGTGQLVETVTGQSGFIRGTLRGLARVRRRAGVGPAEPFTLLAHSDGRLTLVDPSTSRRVDLESFGPTNEAEFVRMLPDRARAVTVAVSH